MKLCGKSLRHVIDYSTPIWISYTQKTSLFYIFKPYMCPILGHAVAQWLRCCATNRKVAGSIPDGVSGFFTDINTSDLTMALGSIQLLTEMSTRSISCG